MRLAGRLMFVGFIMIIAGLGVLVYADPALNAVVIGQSSSTTTTTTTTSTSTGVSSFPGGFGGSGFTISGTGGTGADLASRTSSSTLSTDSIAENSAGLGFAIVGLALVAADWRSRRS